MLPKKTPLVYTYVPEARGKKAHFSEAKFKRPNVSYIFICFHLQLAFHDLFNIFCFVKIELLNSKTRDTI